MDEGFTITFPYKTGTFVKTKDGDIGTIVCYQCVTDKVEYTTINGCDIEEHVVMVSAYRDSWCDEYLLSTLHIMTETELLEYKNSRSIE